MFNFYAIINWYRQVSVVFTLQEIFVLFYTLLSVVYVGISD